MSSGLLFSLAPFYCSCNISSLISNHGLSLQTYVNGLNAAEDNYAAAVASGDVSAAVALQPAIK